MNKLSVFVRWCVNFKWSKSISEYRFGLLTRFVACNSVNNTFNTYPAPPLESAVAEAFERYKCSDGFQNQIFYSLNIGTALGSE